MREILLAWLAVAAAAVGLARLFVGLLRNIVALLVEWRRRPRARGHAVAGPYAFLVEVLFQTGATLHRLPMDTAELIANNLRAWPIEEGSRSLADKIELFLVGESTEPIDMGDLDERRALRQALDVVAAGPHDSPELRELFECLRIERRG